MEEPEAVAGRKNEAAALRRADEKEKVPNDRHDAWTKVVHRRPLSLEDKH